MAINSVTKYLKFANVQMAAESLFGQTGPGVRAELFCAALT